MGLPPVKNKSPKWVVRFLLKQGFTELTNNRGKGDHKCLLNKATGAYTEVDMGRDSFTAREIKTFIKQTSVEEKKWRNA